MFIRIIGVTRAWNSRQPRYHESCRRGKTHQAICMILFVSSICLTTMPLDALFQHLKSHSQTLIKN